MTVHNLAFQGQFARELLPALGLPPASFGVDGVEYYGTIGYLKAGIALADRVTTVSPTYAAEIRTADAGMGLDGLLRTRAEHSARHPQRHRHRRLEPGDGPAYRGPLRRAPALRARGATRRRCRRGSASPPSRGPFCSAS